MKTYLLKSSLLLLFATAFFFNSCKKDTQAPNIPVATKITITDITPNAYTDKKINATFEQ